MVHLGVEISIDIFEIASVQIASRNSRPNYTYIDVQDSKF